MTAYPRRQGPAGRYAIASVFKLEQRANGTVTKTVLSAPKRRRVSKRARKFDKAMRRVARAQQAASSEFLSRHDRSNQKKKNGGLRNLGKNVRKAQRKGLKQLRRH
ncbi:MAG TPA: hypothetical protein VNP97_12545 [Microbacterium sp.]|jgi:hypothetical protein|nr:hypothetical protein [Microbacterium sp.]